MRGRRSVPGLVCAALLVAAPGADAATVAIQETLVRGMFVREMVFVAAPGERNNVVLAAEVGTSGDAVLTVSDSGTALTPGNLCQAISARVVQCRDFASASFFVRVDLGDMDDELNGTGSVGLPVVSRVVANGGAGRDRLVGATNQPQSELRAVPTTM